MTRAAATRYAGALAVLAVGADHLEQDLVDHYSLIPVIGTLFVVNFAAAVAVACALVLPAWRFTGRAGCAVARLGAVAGIGVAAGSAAALLVSERAGLFGFREFGYRPAIVLSLVLDGLAVAVLSAHLLLQRAKDVAPMP